MRFPWDILEGKVADLILEGEAIESSTAVVPLANERILAECNVWVQERQF